ncbi:retinitis pigmentosa 9 protein [Gracilinanus agilis]|uniref:retinitis pigmentosa 9 protein n=1 Tax=Gracilinanus agilis TaxID=191870 RepID=UPI001CFD129A|nr:retinitis pigmentosa 9 protein [Gracilinanus agilis]
MATQDGMRIAFCGHKCHPPTPSSCTVEWRAFKELSFVVFVAKGSLGGLTPDCPSAGPPAGARSIKATVGEAAPRGSSRSHCQALLPSSRTREASRLSQRYVSRASGPPPPGVGGGGVGAPSRWEPGGAGNPPGRDGAGRGGARRAREAAELEQQRRQEQKRRRRDAQQRQQLQHLESFYEKPPPGLIKEDETKPEDCIPDVPGNEHAREFLAHAPTKGLWMPLGKEVKVMQCWRCKRYGHRTGDKECPFFIKGNQKLEQFRVAHEDPMYDIIRENKRHEKDVRIQQLKKLLEDSTSDEDGSSSSSSECKEKHKRKKKKEKHKKRKKEKKKRKKKKKKHKSKSNESSDSD